MQLSRAGDPASLARRLARKTLLSVAGLVSIHDASWTTGRLAAARRWATIKPLWAASLDTLVRWSSGSETAPSTVEVHGALDGVVAVVVDEFESRIGLWRPAAS